MSEQNNSLEYIMPDEIKAMLTKDFCKAFLKELHLIFGVSMSYFDMDYYVYQGGTSGWGIAFATACRKTHNDELYQHYERLDWYLSDQFDGMLEDMLVAYKLVMPEFEAHEVARQNNLSNDDVVACDLCGRYFHVKDTQLVECKELDIPEDEEPYRDVVCNECHSKQKSTVLAYDVMSAIKHHLNLNDSDVFWCKKCQKLHFIEHKGKETCLYCEQSPAENGGSANQYYVNMFEEAKSYKKRIFGE